MNIREWLISTFMLMSVLLTPYAPAETMNGAAPQWPATLVDRSPKSNF